MAKKHLRTWIALFTGMLAAAPAVADVPESLSLVPGIKEIAPINGMRAFASETDPRTYLMAEDGAMIVGEVFGPDSGDNFAKYLRVIHGPVIDLPESTADTVNAQLLALPEEARNQLLNSFVKRIADMGDVKDEAAFNAVAKAWIEELAAVTAQVASQTIVDGYNAVMSADILGFAGEEGAPELVAVIDPACEPCQKSMEALEEKVEAGKIRLRVVPVASQEGSEKVIAQIAMAEDPMETLLSYAKNGDSDLAALKDDKVPEQIMSSLQKNELIRRKAKIEMVPTFFFLDKENAVHAFANLPSDEQMAPLFEVPKADIAEEAAETAD